MQIFTNIFTLQLVCVASVLAQEFTCPDDPTDSTACLEGDYPNPLDCTTYWTCTSICDPYLRDCPSDLHFSPILSYCVNPEIAECEAIGTTRPTTTTTQPTTTTTQPTTTTTEPTTTTTLPTTTTTQPTTTTTLPTTTTTQPTATTTQPTTTTTLPTTTTTLPTTTTTLPTTTLPTTTTTQPTTTTTLPTTTTTLPTTTTTQPTTTTTLPTTTTTLPTTTTTQPTTTTTLPTTTTTLPTTTTSQIKANPSIFFAGRNDNYTLPQSEPLRLPIVETDHRGDWVDELFFVAPEAGFYFFILNAGFMPGERANFVLDGQAEYLSGVRHLTTTNNDIDGGSRDIIVYLEEGSVLYVNQVAGPSGQLYSSPRLETSLGGFSLHNSMDTLSSFCVAKNSSYNTPGIIDYDIVVSQSSNDWDINSDRYIAPEAGTYVFSMSAGVHPTSTARLQLLVDGYVQAELLRYHTDNDDDYVFARTLIIDLDAGQSVLVNLLEGDLQAALRNQISLSGFLYKPISSPKIVWSLHRTTPWDGTTNLYPVNYEEVLVNEGEAYDSNSHVVTIPVSGQYYIHLGVGAANGGQTNLNVEKMRNGEIIDNLIRIRRLSTNHRGMDTMSNGGIYFLEQGDELRIVCPIDKSFESGTGYKQRLTSFQGFLIYSE